MFFNMFIRKNFKSNYFTSAFFLRCSSELSLRFSSRHVKSIQYDHNAELHYFKYLVIAGALLLTVKKAHMENDHDSLTELKELYQSKQYDLITKKA